MTVMLRKNTSFLNKDIKLYTYLTVSKTFFFKMEGHKKEMDTFFGDLFLTLKKIQEETAGGFAQLQQNCDSLKEEVEMTRLTHRKVPLE